MRIANVVNALMLSCIICLFACDNQNKPATRPNVIIIYTDDQGTIDVNSFGASDLHTPNMDRIASSGIRFTQFYAAAPVCSPSRAALMTGKTPLAAGLPGNASSQKGNDGMPANQVTIAEVLKENGYVTGHVGKWHLGYTKATMPLGQGFDYSFGHMGGCIDNYSHFFYWHGPNRHDLWENNEEVWMDGAYFQDLMEEKASAFIAQNKDKAFFLYYAINLPHYPLQGTAKWRTHYKDLEHPRDKYAACVSTVDERIGTLLDQLESLGIRDNTIIIFQSDHGHSMEERTFGGGGNAGIYRGSKFSLFEGGIRVPAMISWPSKIPQGEARDQLAVNVDWFPTILDFCEISYDENLLDGRSLSNVIFNKAPTPHDSFCWYSNENRWAVRAGAWKLLKNPIDPTNKTPLLPGDSLFLVNLKQHPEEQQNQIEGNKEILGRLIQTYTNWRESVPAEN